MIIERRAHELREELCLTAIPKECLPLLDELSGLVGSVEGRTYSHKLLELATRLGSRRWMVRACIHLADQERELARYRFANDYLKRAESLLKQNSSWLAEQSRFFRSRGYFLYDYRGDAERGVEQMRMASSSAKAAGDRFEAVHSLRSLGEMCAYASQPEEAFSVLEECLEVSQQHSFPDEAAEAWRVLGMMSIKAHDWENGEEYLARSYQIFVEIESRRGEAEVWERRGDLDTSRKEFRRALECYQRAITLFEEVGSKNRAVIGLAWIGHVHTECGEYDQALHCVEDVRKSGEAWGNQIVRALGLTGLGEVYTARGEWGRGIEALKSACTLLSQAGAGDYLYRAMQILAEAYEKSGNAREALNCCRFVLDYEKTLASMKVRGTILAFPLRRKLEQVREERAGFQEKEEALARELEEYKNRTAVASLQVAQNRELLEQLRERLQVFSTAEGDSGGVVDTIVRGMEGRVQRADAWRTFAHRLRTFDRDFTARLSKTFPKLTPAEIRICSLMNLGLTNREITDLLNIAGRTIDTHRRNIRQKMGLRPEEDLAEVLEGVEER